SNDMALIGTSGGGSQISLNGIPGMPLNSYGTNGIKSVEDVFKLVEDSQVCIIGADNRINSQFFWNPKVILERLSDERGKAEEACIRAP
ncbi:MAG: hypothetical protein QGI60_01385, partial [archaeon]|nr:hypothetical protein [archaeon]